MCAAFVAGCRVCMSLLFQAACESVSKRLSLLLAWLRLFRALASGDESCGNSLGLGLQKRVALVRAIERHPQNVVLWHMYASVLQEQRQFEAAELAFENALALNPNHLPSLGGFAACLREQHKDSAAEKIESRQRKSQMIAKLSSPAARNVSTRQEAEALLNQVLCTRGWGGCVFMFVCVWLSFEAREGGNK